MRTPLALLALALAAVPSNAQGGGAPFTVQETGQGFGQLAEAVAAIGDGEGTIVIAPGSYRQCVVQVGGSVAYVAREFGTVSFNGTTCEDKAALVLRGRSARVEGLIFENLRVPDGNGAGIRLEQGNLLVRESLFRNSETGILTHDDANAAIRIEQTTFSGLGRCRDDGGCSHSVYVGPMARASVIRTRFERGRGGHYLKIRTPRAEVIDNSFDDSGGEDTNYMIDMPNGSTGRIAGNTFVQGRNKENYSALVVIGAERDNPNDSSGLAISGNTVSLAPGVERGTTFVVDFTGHELAIGTNRIGERIRPFERR